MRRSCKKLLLAGGALALLNGGCPDLALGQTPGSTSDDAVAFLLKSLRDKGILSEAEYRMAMARMRPPVATPSAAQGGADAARSAAGASGSGAGSVQGDPMGSAEVSAASASTPPSSPVEKAVKTTLGDVKLSGSVGSGVGLQIGDVGVKLHASVNGFYVHQSSSPDTPEHQVAGGTATPGQPSSAIRSGFVPGYILVDLTTQQRGFDVAAHFGFYPGVNSAAGSPNLVGVPRSFNVGGMDLRQVNMTVGRPDIGTFKVGRDIGLFEQDAALNDISLLGVGTPPANAAPTNSTNGRIGSGYLYADFIPQITYTSPSIAGFTVSLGVFQPLETYGFSETNGTPGFQYRITYAFKQGDLSAQLWSSGITQKHDVTRGTIGRSYDSRGIDFGGKLGYGPINLIGNYFTGTGLGIAGLFDAPLGSNMAGRDGHGYYVQGTYKLGRFLLGGSYGGSWLDLGRGEPVSDVVAHNTSWIGQVRYSLTDWLNLIGEYTSQRSVAHNGNRATSNSVAAGAVLAF